MIINYFDVKTLYSFFLITLLILSCRKDRPVNENINMMISADKWTKVSDEVVSHLYDVKISDDNSILLLSKDYYFQFDKNFQTIFKYTDFGTATVSNNEFMKNYSFFTFNAYQGGNNSISVNYYLMMDHQIVERTSLSGNELYGGSRKILRINAMVSNDNGGGIAYSSVQSDIYDTIYIYVHFKNSKNITSNKVISIPSTPLENFLFVNQNYFILYGQYSYDYIQVDMINRTISHPNYKPKQIVRIANKLIMLDRSENLLSSEDGKDYQLEIPGSALFLNNGKLNKSTNDSMMVLSTSTQINLINIKNRKQKVFDFNGIPNYGDFACFTYFDKLIMLTDKGIYARLIE